MDRVAIFVDAGNMFFAQKANEWWIDWKLAFQYFTDNRQLYGAHYFTATPTPDRPEKVASYRKFKKFLMATGYKVFDKELRVMTDEETGQTITKGNLDIELVFRMMVAPHQWDEAVVFGCDIDYEPVFQHLRNLGKRVRLVGRRQMVSLDLINACEEFIELNDIRGRIEKQPR